MNRALLIAGLVVLAITVAGGIAYAAGHAFDTTSSQTVTVRESVRRVVVDVDAGDVHLVAGTGRVEVRQDRHYVVRAPKVTRDVRDGVLTLRSHCPGPGMLDCSTDFRVGLPRGVAAEVRTGVGDVGGRELHAPDVRATTHVGDVALDLARPAARVEGHSDVGDVHLTVPAGTYAVAAGTDVGERDVRGLVQDDRAARAIEAGSDVGDVSVRAR
jgi:hypothetical protein